MSKHTPRLDYAEWRRSEILSMFESLSHEAYADWVEAAVRLQLKIDGLRIDDALELLITLYATNDLLPMRELVP